MTILKAIILGIIQGITEFLPISSSGHMEIASHYLKLESQDLLFDVLLHMGTLTAIILVFSKDIRKLLREIVRIILDIIYNIRLYIANKKNNEAYRYQKLIRNNYSKFAALVLVATLPTAVIGYALRYFILGSIRSLLVPGICLFITGILLFVTDFMGRGKKIPRDIGYLNSFFIGIGQGFATLPGVSRSGTTIALSLMSGFDRKFAVRYSFILSIPAVIGATILEFTEYIKGPQAFAWSLMGTYIIGAIFAGVVGYFCIRKMLVFIRRKRLRYFAYYCFAVGIFAIATHFF